jgi:hypothetical protein
VQFLSANGNLRHRRRGRPGFYPAPTMTNGSEVPEPGVIAMLPFARFCIELRMP